MWVEGEANIATAFHPDKIFTLFYIRRFWPRNLFRYLSGIARIAS